MVWTIIFGSFGVICGICGIWSLIYTRRQTTLMAQDIQQRKVQDTADADWALRYEKLVNQLRNINPVIQVQEPGTNSTIALYATIFPDVKFRSDLQVYIVPLDRSQTQFVPKSPRPDELRSPKMREIIAKAEALIQKFRKEHPGGAHHLG